MQSNIAVENRERRARIIVPRLSNRTRIAICLAGKFVQRLNMRMPRKKDFAADCRKVVLGWFQKILIYGIRPAAMNHMNISHAPIYWERSQPVQILRRNHLSQMHEAIIHTL